MAGMLARPVAPATSLVKPNCPFSAKRRAMYYLGTGHYRREGDPQLRRRSAVGTCLVALGLVAVALTGANSSGSARGAAFASEAHRHSWRSAADRLQSAHLVMASKLPPHPLKAGTSVEDLLELADRPGETEGTKRLARIAGSPDMRVERVNAASALRAGRAVASSIQKVAFPGLGLGDERLTVGEVTPPDPQIAVSGDHVVEMVNSMA